VLARAGIETWLFERKLDNAKPCGGAIPLCMVSEFDIPESIIDRKVRFWYLWIFQCSLASDSMMTAHCGSFTASSHGSR
jgi:hypothetical protein